LKAERFIFKHFWLVIVIILGGFLLHLIAREWISQRSEALYDAEWHSKAMAEVLKRELSHHHPMSEVLSKLDSEEYFSEFDVHVQQMVGHAGLLGLKVYDSQGTIIYSNNREQIGRGLHDNELFNTAKQGEIVSEIVSKIEYQSEYGIASDVDMAEVSIPIRSEVVGNIEYVMEVYYDFSPLQERMKTMFISKAISLFTFFAVVIALLSFLFRNKRKLEQKIEVLESVLPICQHCKNIRLETPGKPDSWLTVEKYFLKQNKVKFSHGICNECLSEHYPDLSNRTIA
jgi:hypothetical protein